LPIAKHKRQYKRLHWVPVTLTCKQPRKRARNAKGVAA
jgi:hypothetical protein